MSRARLRITPDRLAFAGIFVVTGLGLLAVYDALPGPDKEIVHFGAADGANFHCEPMAGALLNQRVFDWLDDRLA